MLFPQIWSSADVDAVPADARNIKLHRVDPEIVEALNRRSVLPRIDLAGNDLDDDQLGLLTGIHGLDTVCLYDSDGLSDVGFRAILAIEGLRGLTVWSNGGNVTEEGFASVGDCSTIECLAFDNSMNVTDRVIEAIGQLHRLRVLFLETWELSQRAFRPLRHMKTLRVLQVSAYPTEVDHIPLLDQPILETLRLYAARNSAQEANRVVAKIWGLSLLKELLLVGYPVSESVLEGVRGLHDLRILRLGSNRRVGGAAAEAISHLKDLRELGLQRTGVTDQGLRHLATLPRIKHLNLLECPHLTGDGVLGLGVTTSLESLNLRGCSKVSMSAARSLAEELPDCLVGLPDGSRSWSDERIREHKERLRGGS